MASSTTSHTAARLRRALGAAGALTLSALCAAGCSGGGGSSGAVAAPAAGTNPPPAPAPGPRAGSRASPAASASPANNGGGGGGGAPPADPTDAQVRAALAGANIDPVQLAPAESDELVALGQALFFDKVLSGNKNIACATCHHPSAFSGDGLPLSLGEGASGQTTARTRSADDQVIPRHAPALFHVGARNVRSMFWDSRVTRDGGGVLQTPVAALNGATPARPDITAQLTSALAAQAMFPVTSSEEMRGDPGENELADAANELDVWALLMARLVGTSEGTTGGIEAYRTLFKAAYPTATFDSLTFGHAARAIAAAYEARTFAFFDAPLDRYLAGDDTALSAAAKRGAVLFTGQARCSRCHSGPLLSDFNHHALATPQLGPGKGGEPDDRGRALETGNPADDYRFRTPSLRNVSLTGPYMHAGSLPSLQRVLAHYRNPGNSLLNYDPNAELPAAFRALVDTDPTRNQARLNQVDGIVGNGIPLNAGERADIVAFLEALTDPAATTPVAVPSTVPSGLAVGD